MNFNEYQTATLRTANNTIENKEKHILLFSLAFAGEVGEYCNKVKKLIGHKHDISIDELGEELGDCLWYIAALCDLYDLHLEDIAKGNIDKLKKRYPNGFSEKDSIERVV